MYAEDSPEAVAAAVRENLRRTLDRAELRRSVMHRVLFDRHDFVSIVNDIVASTYRVSDLFDSYSRFLGYMEYRPATEILGELEAL